MIRCRVPHRRCRGISITSGVSSQIRDLLQSFSNTLFADTTSTGGKNRRNANVNPILCNNRVVLNLDDDCENNTDNDNKTSIPIPIPIPIPALHLDLQSIQPHHAQDAYQKLVVTRDQQLEQLLRSIRSDLKSEMDDSLKRTSQDKASQLSHNHNHSNTAAAASTSTSSSSTSILTTILSKLNQIQAPIRAVQQIASLHCLLSPRPSQQQEWNDALDFCCHPSKQQQEEEDEKEQQQQHRMMLRIIMEEILKLVSEMEEGEKDEVQSANQKALALQRSIRHVLQMETERTGFNLHHHDSSDRERFQQLSTNLASIERRLLSAAATTTTTSSSHNNRRLSQSLLNDMYGFLATRQEQIQLLTTNNNSNSTSSVADYVLTSQRRMLTSVDQIQFLHQSVADRVVPILHRDYSHLILQSKNSVLSSYLSKSGSSNSSTAASNKNPAAALDERQMIRLEDHVTLDGALMFVSYLWKDLLGLSFEVHEDNNNNNNNNNHGGGGTDSAIQAWNKDVRLFHVYKTSTTATNSGSSSSSSTGDSNNAKELVGSFYLDPFRRPEKLSRPVTTILYSRCGGGGEGGGHQNAPILCVSLGIQPPVWDTDSVRLSWDDVAALLHELGHVADYLTAPIEYGAIAGLESFPFDRSELLPKFMEHWLTDISSIYALMHLSQSSAGFSDDSIHAAFRVRSRRKVLELAQQVFYGELERHLFSREFNLQQESMLAVQERIANQFIPHDVPEPKNLTPLLDIFQENASGREVAWYRYLLCDAWSAHIFSRMKQELKNEKSDGAVDSPSTNKSRIKDSVSRSLIASDNPEPLPLDSESVSALFQLYEIPSQ